MSFIPLDTRFNPFEQMQKAVDIVNTSPHPTNKIAATLCGFGPEGDFFSVSRTNYWPPALLRHFGVDARIGNSSGTVHAETECILTAPAPTEGSHIFVTDPFCPNCAKNIAEAGLKTIYIDHKGFDKDFAARRGHHFSSLSMQICEKAGISVYEIRRKEQRTVPILEAPATYIPANENPVRTEEMPAESTAATDRAAFAAHAGTVAQAWFPERRIAAAAARAPDGRMFMLAACRHPVVGYSLTDDDLETDGKYSFFLEPLNRVLMNAARLGLRIKDGMIYSSAVPTAREQVNLIGAGLSALTIGNRDNARDASARDALETLTAQNILTATFTGS